MTKAQKRKAIIRAAARIESGRNNFSCCALNCVLPPHESLWNPVVREYADFYGQVAGQDWGLDDYDSHIRVMLLLWFAEAGI